MATYTQFDETRDTVNTIDRVFASAWTNNTNELFQFHSSSTQYVQTTPSSSGNYFMEIYNENPQLSSSTAEVQFSIAAADPVVETESSVNLLIYLQVMGVMVLVLLRPFTTNIEI